MDAFGYPLSKITGLIVSGAALCGLVQNTQITHPVYSKQEMVDSARRGTEAVITALTRNQMVGGTRHAGSNPALSATYLSKSPYSKIASYSKTPIFTLFFLGVLHTLLLKITFAFSCNSIKLIHKIQLSKN